MATVTKSPYTIPKHKYWLTIEDKYLVDYSEEVKQDINEEQTRIDELKRLKQIDCFNEAYSTDVRCSRHIDIRIKQLQAN